MASADDLTKSVESLRGFIDTIGNSLAEVGITLGKVTTVLTDLISQLDPDPDPPTAPDVTFALGLVASDSIKVTWATTGDVEAWRVSRDGSDILGSGPWSGVVHPEDRAFTFQSLQAGTPYTLKLEPVLKTGVAPGLTLKATTAGATAPGTATAATKFGWGTPTFFDDFNGPLNTGVWLLPGKGGWDGHVGNGRRMPENVFTENGSMVLRGDANGNTGWVRHNKVVTYGRWEIRSKSSNTGTSGGLYHPLALIWPSPEKWPDNGELDWLEYTDPNAKQASAWLHYPHKSGIAIQQAGPFSKSCDMTVFHNFAFEWSRTGVRAWIDGEPWYEVKDGGGPNGRKNIQDMPAGSLTIQLDNFTGDGGLRPARFEIDSVKFWALT